MSTWSTKSNQSGKPCSLAPSLTVILRFCFPIIEVCVIATKAEIDARIKELAAQVAKDYDGKNLLLVGVLKGAVMVMADLTRALDIHVEMDWMAVSSYGSGTKSSGVVRILKDLDRDITNREVLIVEIS